MKWGKCKEVKDDAITAEAFMLRIPPEAISSSFSCCFPLTLQPNMRDRVRLLQMTLHWHMTGERHLKFLTGRDIRPEPHSGARRRPKPVEAQERAAGRVTDGPQTKPAAWSLASGFLCSWLPINHLQMSTAMMSERLNTPHTHRRSHSTQVCLPLFAPLFLLDWP